MPKMMRPAFLFLALGLCLACGLGEGLENFSVEPVAPENPEYVGHWHSDTGVDLVISDNGMLNYENTSGGMSKTLEMPIQSWTETGFEAGIGVVNTPFVVSSPPEQQDDGSWQMTVDGVVLTRIE